MSFARRQQISRAKGRDRGVYDFVDQLDATSDFLEKWPGERPLMISVGKLGHVTVTMEVGWFWRVVDATRAVRPDATCKEDPMGATHHLAQKQTHAVFYLGGGVSIRSVLTPADRQE